MTVQRVMMVHNRYQSASPSGENTVVDAEVTLLRAAGVEVNAYLRSSDDIEGFGLLDTARLAISPVIGHPTAGDLETQLVEFRPDVMHLHNAYPLISPTAISLAHRHGVPVVMTVHNFRMKCLNGLFFRDGQICVECEQSRVPVKGVLHGCYRDSRPASVSMAVALTRHRPTWAKVSMFIAVSGFVRDRLVSWGIPADRIVVKANSAADPGPPVSGGEGFLYAGRLSREKGLDLLMEAWDCSGLDGTSSLTIAGSGELLDVVRDWARRHRSVTVTGLLDPEALAAVRRRTAVSIMCSTWFEAHPSIGESFAHGRPVVATRVGALATVVDDEVGWLAEPSAEALAATLVAATDRSALERRSLAARARWADTYAPSVVVGRLRAAYAAAVAHPA